ncbi:hypothetical protein D9M69_569400 [compost metagenome]
MPFLWHHSSRAAHSALVLMCQPAPLARAALLKVSKLLLRPGLTFGSDSSSPFLITPE